jgi:hypothetical protein
MSIRRNAVYVIGGLVAFVAASTLMAVSTTVVDALIPQKKSDPPGEMQETLEEKGKRLAAEEKSKNDKEMGTTEQREEESASVSVSEENQSASESSGESVVVSTPSAPPTPPAPAPASGPGNMGHEPQYYPPSAPGGPGNLN